MARKICAVLCARTVPVGGGLRVRPRRRDQGIPAVRGSLRPIPAHSGRSGPLPAEIKVIQEEIKVI